MTSSISFISGVNDLNKYNSIYQVDSTNDLKSYETIKKEAEGDEDTDQDTTATLSPEDQAKIDNTNALVAYLKASLGTKYDSITRKIEQLKQKRSGSSSSSSSSSGTSETSGSSGTTGTVEYTEDQLKVKASAQSLLSSMLGDSSVATRYENMMKKINGTYSYGTGTTTTSKTSTQEDIDKAKQKVATFVAEQQSFINNSKYSNLLNKLNSKDTNADTSTTSENISTYSSAQLNNLVKKTKF